MRNFTIHRGSSALLKAIFQRVIMQNSNIKAGRLNFLYLIMIALALFALVTVYLLVQKNHAIEAELNSLKRVQFTVFSEQHAGKLFPDIRLSRYPDSSTHAISSFLSAPHQGLLLSIFGAGCQPCTDLVAKSLLSVEKDLNERQIKSAFLVESENASQVIKIIKAHFPGADCYLIADSISVRNTFPNFPVMLFLLSDQRILMTHYPSFDRSEELGGFLKAVSGFETNDRLVFHKKTTTKRGQAKLLGYPFVLEAEIPLQSDVLISDVRDLVITDNREIFVIDQKTSELFVFNETGFLIDKISKDDVLDPGRTERMALVNVEPTRNDNVFLVYRGYIDYFILFDRKTRIRKKIFVKTKGRTFHTITKVLTAPGNQLVALAYEPILNTSSKIYFMENNGKITKESYAFPNLRYPMLTKVLLNYEQIFLDSKGNLYCMTALDNSIYLYDLQGNLIRSYSLEAIKPGLVRPEADFDLRRNPGREESFGENDFLRRLFILDHGYLVIGRDRRDRIFYDVFRFKDNMEIEHYVTIEGNQDSPLMAANGKFIYGYRWPFLSRANELQNIVITKYSLNTLNR